MKETRDTGSGRSAGRSQVISRRKFLGSAGAVGLSGLAGCSGVLGSGSSPTEINVLMPQGFLSVRDKIESRIDANVNLLADVPVNETGAATQLSKESTKYDVGILGNNFVPKLHESGALAPVQTDLLSNYNKVYKKFRTESKDQFGDSDGVYGVPLLFDRTGYAYHTDHVPDHDPSWDTMLADSIGDTSLENKVVMLNEHEPVIAAGLLQIGATDVFNGTRIDVPAETLKEVKGMLSDRSDIVLRASTPPEFNYNLTDPTFLIGQTYRGAVLSMAAENEKMKPGSPWAFAHPKKGSLVWFQTGVVPAASDKKETAWKVVNELISGPIGAQLAVNTFSTSTTPAVDEHLSSGEITPASDVSNFDQLDPAELFGSLSSSTLADLILMRPVVNENDWKKTFEDLVEDWQKGSSCGLC